MMQINPPFDGSAPCPACQTDLREVSALLHNTFTRWPQPKAFVRLNDLRRTPIPTELAVPHPVAQELLDVARAVVAACEGMTDDGNTIRWTPATFDLVSGLAPRIKAALDAFDALSDSHFHDRRHSSGDDNILRASRGTHWAGFVAPDYKAAAYDYTVEVVSEGAHIRHLVCDTGLRLHEHFLSDLRRDGTFFGKVWCPTCRTNAPISQWDVSGGDIG